MASVGERFDDKAFFNVRGGSGLPPRVPQSLGSVNPLGWKKFQTNLSQAPGYSRFRDRAMSFAPDRRDQLEQRGFDLRQKFLQDKTASQMGPSRFTANQSGTAGKLRALRGMQNPLTAFNANQLQGMSKIGTMQAGRQLEDAQKLRQIQDASEKSNIKTFQDYQTFANKDRQLAYDLQAKLWAGLKKAQDVAGWQYSGGKGRGLSPSLRNATVVQDPR